jgi:hypothetical protein
MSHTVSLELPDSVGVTLRGIARSLDVSKLPANVIVALFEKGVQRASNDPLGAVFDKDTEVTAEAVDTYWNELTTRWFKGEIAKARIGGGGRVTDPVKKEVRRLADAEVTTNLTALLAHHGVSKKEFEADYRSKYVAARIEKHAERLDKEARANLAKLGKSADIELLDME